MVLKKGDSMVQRARRNELGKMLMDISKYLFTVGLIGSLVNPQEKGLEFWTGLAVFFVAAVCAVTGFYVIPRDKKEGQS